MNESCFDCINFEGKKCKLKPAACLNYDHFQWLPMIQISPHDLEEKYVSRTTFNEMKERAEKAEKELAALREQTRWIQTSERQPIDDGTLPPEDCFYQENGDLSACEFLVLIDVEGTQVKYVLSYNFRRNSWTANEEVGPDPKVVAWQCLPRYLEVK